VLAGPLPERSGPQAPVDGRSIEEAGVVGQCGVHPRAGLGGVGGDGLRQQAEALAASIVQAEQQLQDLTAKLDKQKAEMAGLQNGLPAATTTADTAATALTSAAKAAEEKKAVIAARQAEADAAAQELEPLQAVPR
jgi:hypothetical protein